ncbi:type III-B CRISPR module-associated Cmr3 family protein [Rhodoferax sp.]|uniref:type III-B CRISPR module-associated Cmr3 family protein n=1 Tax=Rhodoferax sp. TaxID=50421 RepID=UPI00271873DB|nr:type III-B CRISPR module-associated Cmr3 family protein [Rhodoferax sp.]MDO8320507.1 type III-B CRISPR module-associated Cmr3 family protein [Rhodoferax sp.]
MSTPSPATYYYVRPTDSLFVRGNLAFGDAGEHGSSQMPPPPSLFAGAFRSALLGQDAEHLSSFLNQGRCSDAALARCLGSAEAPGEFRISWLSLAGASSAGTEPEPISPLPADLLLLGKTFATLAPRAVQAGVQSAGDLPLRATLVSAKQEKPSGGMYLHAKGLAQHLSGQHPEQRHGIASSQLFVRDPRLGIGLNTDAHTAEEGQIYTTEGFAFSPRDDAAPATFASTGFLVGLQGVSDLMPQQGVLRLGGDGRSAHYRRVAFNPNLNGLAAAVGIHSEGAAPTKGENTLARFRLILQTPALFSQGWLPEGITRQDDGSYRLQGDGFTARLACAALGRREVVSGWDLYQWMPKPAQAAVPAGSVYWFDEFAGDAGKLTAWVNAGLWPHNPNQLQQSRRAEGYNCALLGAWN